MVEISKCNFRQFYKVIINLPFCELQSPRILQTWSGWTSLTKKCIRKGPYWPTRAWHSDFMESGRTLHTCDSRASISAWRFSKNKTLCRFSNICHWKMSCEFLEFKTSHIVSILIKHESCVSVCLSVCWRFPKPPKSHLKASFGPT